MMHTSVNTTKIRPLSLLKRTIVKGGRRPLEVPIGLFKGIKLNLDLAHETQKYLGFYETETNQFIRMAASRCRWAVDVGAGGGELILYLLFRSQCERIVAFEPQQSEVAMLRSNLVLNALQESKKLEIRGDLVGNNPGPGFIKLDAIGLDHQQKGFIKIDVDGQEMEVLLSGTELFSKGDVDLIIETHSEDLEKQCTGLLERYGYKCSVIKNAWWRFFVPERRLIPHNRWLSATKPTQPGSGG